MDAFIGEIRAFTWGWPPQGWMVCDGNTFLIQQYQALAAVLGTTYGGDGKNTIGLPNLQGQVLNGVGQSTQSGVTYTLGGKGGLESVPLNYTQMPLHNHSFNGASNKTATEIYNNVTVAPANGSFLTLGFEATPTNAHAGVLAFNKLAPDTELAPNAVGPTGGGAPHENRQPFLVLMYCICWEGVYPVPS